MAALLTNHLWRPSPASGATSTGTRGGIGQDMCPWLGTCNRPQDDHITTPDFRAGRTTAPYAPEVDR